MDQYDIRWEQRFFNYKKALGKLEETVTSRKLAELSYLEKEGLIQRFEYTYELAWKTLQDLLKHKGYADVSGPNPVLQQALKDGYIEQENHWRLLKKSREITSYTYNEATADSIAEDIYTTYFKLLKQLELRLEEEKSGQQGDIFDG